MCRLSSSRHRRDLGVDLGALSLRQFLPPVGKVCHGIAFPFHGTSMRFRSVGCTEQCRGHLNTIRRRVITFSCLRFLTNGGLVSPVILNRPNGVVHSSSVVHLDSHPRVRSTGGPQIVSVVDLSFREPITQSTRAERLSHQRFSFRCYSENLEVHRQHYQQRNIKAAQSAVDPIRDRRGVAAHESVVSCEHFS